MTPNLFEFHGTFLPGCARCMLSNAGQTLRRLVLPFTWLLVGPLQFIAIVFFTLLRNSYMLEHTFVWFAGAARLVHTHLPSWPTKEKLQQATCATGPEAEIKRNWTGGRIRDCPMIDTAPLTNGRGAYPEDVQPGHTSLGVLRRLWNRRRPS